MFRDKLESGLIGLIGLCMVVSLLAVFVGCTAQATPPPAPPSFSVAEEPTRAATIAYKPPRIEIAPPPEDHPASATRCACGVDCRCRAPCTLHHLGARVDHSGGYYELEWVWHPVAHTPPVRASPPAGWTCGPDGCFQGNDGFEPARRGLLRRR